jgi:hypothetical protein
MMLQAFVGGLLEPTKWCGKVEVKLIAYIRICCYMLESLVLVSIFCQHLQVEDYDLTYARCSFEATLNQTMHRLGYDWKYAYEWPTLTTERFQTKLFVTKRKSDPPPRRPPLTIVSRPYARTCEAWECALLNVLLYVNDICGYHIGDLHFTELIIRESQIRY